MYLAMALVNEAPARGKRLNIVVAEASPMECQLLANAIERHCRFHVSGCFVNSDDVVSAIRTGEPDVAVISARLQDGTYAGLSATSKLQRFQVRSPIVILLDSEGSPQLVVECFRLGAKGVFNRTAPFKELCKCVTWVGQGQIWASSTALKYVVEAVAKPSRLGAISPKIIGLLSKREQEVLGLVVAGSTNREIAECLDLNEHTVRNYLSHIFE